MASTTSPARSPESSLTDDTTTTVNTSPTIQQFMTSLKHIGSWYSLGVLLKASKTDLDYIRSKHQHQPVIDHLIDLFSILEKRDILPTWSEIVHALHSIGENKLAHELDGQYCQFGASSPSTNVIGEPSTDSATVIQSSDESHQVDDHKFIYVPQEITQQFERINTKFCFLVSDIMNGLERVGRLRELKTILQEQLELTPPLMSESEVSVQEIFLRIKPHYSCLKYEILSLLVERFLKNDDEVQKSFRDYKLRIRTFKKSTKMRHFVKLLNKKQRADSTSQVKMVQLKTRKFWGDITMERFETAMKQIMVRVYQYSSYISVEKGCFAISWVVPQSIQAELVEDDITILSDTGIISLKIGDKVVHESSGDGCETIEAAMLQAIQLKNTRAIELLLAVGCSPQVAIYNDSNTVTNIVNIRAIESKESSSDGSSGPCVDHVCILGHNEYVEAIIDPNREPECSYCSMKEKVNKQLHQEVDSLREAVSIHLKTKAELVSKIEVQEEEIQKLKSQEFIQSSLHSEELLKLKDAEIKLLNSSNQLLVREKMSKDMEMFRMKEENTKFQSVLSALCDNSTAVLPCQRRRLGVKAEMKVIVTTRDKSGKELVTGGSFVRAVLTCNDEECPVTDNNDGTYTITVIPQQLGQHQLSITVNGKYIQGSPFTLDIVPQRDYTKIGKRHQAISGINYPRSIAFNENGDIFVTSYGDCCIQVYTKDGRKKTTIGSMSTADGPSPLKFNFPHGIDIFDSTINGSVMYVVEKEGNRIHQLTTDGKFIGMYGEKGSAIGQFNSPCDIKVSQEGKAYVADRDNNRVQVFNPDWSISHVIDGNVRGKGNFTLPEAIAIDLSGNLHITGFGSSSVVVFSSLGKFIRCYGDKTIINNPTGIAIDPSGYSLVNLYGKNSLLVFDSNGTFVSSLGGFYRPYGVSVSPIDDTVWVVDSMQGKLVQF